MGLIANCECRITNKGFCWREEACLSWINLVINAGFLVAQAWRLALTMGELITIDDHFFLPQMRKLLARLPHSLLNNETYL